jgi:hypothetical protein
MCTESQSINLERRCNLGDIRADATTTTTTTTTTIIIIIIVCALNKSIKSVFQWGNYCQQGDETSGSIRSVIS